MWHGLLEQHVRIPLMRDRQTSPLHLEICICGLQHPMKHYSMHRYFLNYLNCAYSTFRMQLLSVPMRIHTILHSNGNDLNSWGSSYLVLLIAYTGVCPEFLVIGRNSGLLKCRSKVRFRRIELLRGVIKTQTELSELFKQIQPRCQPSEGAFTAELDLPLVRAIAVAEKGDVPMTTWRTGNNGSRSAILSHGPLKRLIENKNASRAKNINTPQFGPSTNMIQTWSTPCYEIHILISIKLYFEK